MFKKILIGITLSFTFACAHKLVQEETPVIAATTVTPPQLKPRVKYIYVETPSTQSAMTTAPFEKETDQPTSLRDEVVHIFWPLLTLLAFGALMIAGLMIEHLVLNRLLARRAAFKAQLRTIS
jgi:hypothetical protein